MVNASSSPQPDHERLARGFYARNTVDVARDLLGKLLCRRRVDGTVVSGRVVETEAYHGLDDAASHAFGGPTPRSQIMFGRGGVAYVYQIYGMWFCLNAVTGDEGFPSAVLVRAVEVVDQEARAGAGPGKLCRALGIDKRDNGEDLVDGRGLWLADDGMRVKPRGIARGPRIGVDYAGAWAKKPWRFWLTDHPSVSRKK